MCKDRETGLEEAETLARKFVAPQKVELDRTLETVSVTILQVRKLRLGEGNDRHGLTRPISFIPALTHPSVCLSSAKVPGPESAVLCFICWLLGRGLEGIGF